MKTETFSLQMLARLLHRDRETIQRSLAGVAPDAIGRGHSRYRLSTVRRALRRREREAGDGELAIEQTCLVRERVAELRRRNEKFRAENVPVETVRVMLDVQFTAMRERCLRFSSEIAGRLASQSRDDVWAMLDEGIRALLQELSNSEITVAKPVEQ